MAAALVVAGAFVAIFPQMLITHHQRGSWSPTPPDARVIAMQQLSDGLVVQKYETFAGPTSRYPQPEVFFFDPATQHVLHEENLSTTEKVLGQYTAITSYSQYLGVVVRHPVELAASYVRRVFNGLDVRYPTPYILDLGNTSVVLSLLEYSLIFGAFAWLVTPTLRRRLGSVRWTGVVVLLSPILTAIPSEAESRFFLPLQLLIYMLACFGLGAEGLFSRAGLERRVAFGVTYVGFLLVCLTLSTATQSHIEYPSGTFGLGQSAPSGTGSGGP